MGDLPSGAVTFLFTDVEGSTRLWAADSDAMSASLQVHDQIMREVVDSHSGYVFTTAGDAFCVAFDRASEAVACAEAAQTILSDADWPGPVLRVRMGLHLGEAEERGGDYFGPTVNTAARVEAAGSGGQTLITDAVRSVTQVEAIGLGAHMLRDVATPIRLYQLGDGSFPPLRSAGGVITLPTPRNPLIGRAVALEDLRVLLDSSRLVTITGVGGCGKTRLAIEAAWRSIEEYPGGVFFCELTKVQVDEEVVEAFLLGLTIALAPDVDPDQQVVDFLAESESLVVLDNCEHVLDGVAEILETILARCPNTRVLATSREAVAIEGERVWRIPSLPTGEDSPAVELFCERARAADSSFSSEPASMPVITDICERLDGIPYAIELAAARVTSLSLVGMRDRLDDRFQLLSGGRRRGFQRQQTLESVVAWSYNLLDGSEQKTLCALAVFSDGFDLRDVGPVAGITDDQAFEVIDSLVAKSLVDTQRNTEGDIRYRLLETIRLYGLQKLTDTGSLQRLRDAHLDRFAALARSRLEAVKSLQPEDLVNESENCLSAMLWAEESGRRDLMSIVATAVTRELVYRRADGALPWLDVSAVSLDAEKLSITAARGLTHQARGHMWAVADEATAALSYTALSPIEEAWHRCGARLVEHVLDPAEGLVEVEQILDEAVQRGADPELLQRELGGFRMSLLFASEKYDEVFDTGRIFVDEGSSLMAFTTTAAAALCGRLDEAEDRLTAATWRVNDPFAHNLRLARMVLALYGDGPDAAAAVLTSAIETGFIRNNAGAQVDVIAAWGWIAAQNGDRAHAARLLRLSYFTTPVVHIIPRLLASAEGWTESDYPAKRREYLTDRYSGVIDERFRSDYPSLIGAEIERWR